MERGTRDLLIDAFRNVFKKKMNHFPEEVPGIWCAPPELQICMHTYDGQPPIS